MALDPSLFSDLDALRAAGKLPPLGAPAVDPLVPRPGEVGFRGGATDFRGAKFGAPGPNLAAQRAAAAPAATGARPALKAGKLARGGAATVLGLSAEGAYSAIQETNKVAATPENRVERGLKILAGLNPVTALTSLIEAGVDVAAGGSQSELDRRTGEFGVPRVPRVAVPVVEPAAPAAPPVAAPAAPAAAAEPITKITNADGSTSYTNVKKDVLAATERGATTAAFDPAASGGTFSVVPGVSEGDRARALSASLSGRQFALARGIANTPELMAQVDRSEALFDAQEGVRSARTVAGRNRAEKRVGNLLALHAAQAQADATGTKAAFELLKGQPAAEKTAAETRKLNAQLGLIGRLVGNKSISEEDAALMLSGLTPERTKADVFPSLVPGGPAQVVTTRGARPPRAVEVPVQKPAKVGDTVRGPDGKLGVVQADGTIKPKK